MTLNEIRGKSFEDLLYATNTGIQLGRLLPADLLKTDEFFLENVFKIYNQIEENKIIATECSVQTGATVAFDFIICYYSLFYPEITIVARAGAGSNRFASIYNFFMGFFELDYELNVMANQIILSYKGTKYCDIFFFSEVFDIANLKGVILFDNVSKISNNKSKYEDMLRNKGKYDKLIMNFPMNANMANLVKEFSLKLINIEIL